MSRNEYRRAFIMLRAVQPGYGGHVRLERRTLTGSMYFTITAPQGVDELSAALVGQRSGEYYAAPIGALIRDRRGQLALAWPFDPRNIHGRPLEAYAWLAVVATGGACALALTGNVEGSRPLDPRALERAACALFATRQPPAADLPDRSDAFAEEPPVSEASADEPQPGSDVRVYTLTRTRLRRAQRSPAGPDEAQAQARDQTPAPNSATLQEADAAPAAIPEVGRIAPDPGQDPAAGKPAADAVSPEPATDPAIRPEDTPLAAVPETGPDPAVEPEAVAPAIAGEAEPAAPPLTAARRLGLDITVPWAGAAGPLRRLFATQPPAQPAPEDGFTYVRMPMPEGSGYPDSLVGLRADEGRIAGIRHALPGRRTPEPPPGMEHYTWMPSDGENGFWTTEAGADSDLSL